MPHFYFFLPSLGIHLPVIIAADFAGVLILCGIFIPLDELLLSTCLWLQKYSCFVVYVYFNN